ncbi:MAG: DUF448 domain-containing protein [Deltaproteobacteria bacterium]|nr:DUF448 domain-containing protein [Deltaproteobacteria bacterium]
MKKAAPVRMCVGCGKRDLQRSLLRFSLGAAGMLVADAGQGRSGYLHPQRECVQAFSKVRSGFVRSLRVVVSQEIRAQYIAQLEHRTMLFS